MAQNKDLFRTRDHVAAFDTLVLEYGERSAAARSRLRSVLDVPYGSGAGEALDLFLPEAVTGLAPVHVFVHGGYWRMFAKEDFSFVAEPITAEGAIAVVIDYALMPDVRMSHIVDQVRRAVRWVATNIEQYGGDPSALSISGHSAGAHLCCWLLSADADTPPIRSALLLSGVYDLAPLRSSFLHALIALTDDEVERWSPLTTRFATTATILVAVGEVETAPFHEQARQMAAHLAKQKIVATVELLPANDHMTAVRDLAIPRSSAAGAMRLTLHRGSTAGQNVLGN
jgi:arylformamidase